MNRVLLIRPSFGSGPGGRYSSTLLEPLALGILAALTPSEWQVETVDERLQPILPAPDVSLVAISTCTFSARRAYEIAALYRGQGIPVVLGGIHPTLAPDEAQEHCDVVAVGDAEAVWPQILADASKGCLQPRYQPATPAPAVPVEPDRSVYRLRSYLPLRLVQFGRGCRHCCEFCSVQAMYGRTTVRRSVDQVIAELETCRARRVFFVDDNMLGDRAALYELLRALLPLRLRWSSQMDLTIADDPELLDLLRPSGCQSLTIGFESLSQDGLAAMGKGWSQATAYRDRLARLRRAGIMIYGTFVHGHDGETPADIVSTLRFAREERLFLANFNPLQPFPGTPLFARLQAQGRLRYERWWLEPSYRWHQALFEPGNMSADQLTNACCRARQDFHSLASVLQRLPGAAHLASLDNLILYLCANWFSRRDIRAKTGLGLGTWNGKR